MEKSKKYMHEDGYNVWYLPSKGKDYWHRLNGPAIEYENGLSKEWFVDNKRHRLDGPAIDDDGHKEWWVDGNLHRIGNPAIEQPDGTTHWFVNNEVHRLDGPAVEYADGEKFWYVNDKLLHTKEVEDWLEENNIDLKTEDGQLAFKLRFS